MAAKNPTRLIFSVIQGLVIMALLIACSSRVYKEEMRVQETNEDFLAAEDLFVAMANPVYTVRDLIKGKNGGVSAFFDVDSPQAEKIILNSDAELHRRGYSRIEMQWPYLKEPSSHTRGWVAGAPDQINQSIISNEEWDGSWRGPGDEVVSLVCSRRDSHGQSGMADVVTINMFYYPNAVAKRMEIVIPDEEVDRIIKLHKIN